MTVSVHSEKLRLLVDEDAEVEQIATGFTFTEGPIWMADGSLHFSDMPGDKRRRWHPGEGVSVLRDPSNKCNGMTRDDAGNLIVCEHVTSSVVREYRDGRRETIASHHAGEEWSTLYLAASTSVYRLELRVGGKPARLHARAASVVLTLEHVIPTQRRTAARQAHYRRR